MSIRRIAFRTERLLVLTLARVRRHARNMRKNGARRSEYAWLRAATFFARFGGYITRRSMLLTFLLTGAMGYLLMGIFGAQIDAYLATSFKSESYQALFASVLVAVGAATFGILAIVFAISIFLIQQSIERTSYAILLRILGNKTFLMTFFVVGGSATLFFAGGIAYRAIDPFLLSVGAFSLLLLVAAAIIVHYRTVVRLLSPKYQMGELIISHVKWLRYFDRRIDAMIRVGMVKVPEDTPPNDQYAVSRAAVIYRSAEHLKHTGIIAQQIVSLVRIHFRKGDYEITRHGLMRISELTNAYLHLKRGAIFSSPPLFFEHLDQSHEPYLSEVLEQLAGLARLAEQSRDVEFFWQLIDCHAQLAQICATIVYAGGDRRSRYHSMLAIGYLMNLSDAGVRLMLADIPMRVAHALSPLSIVLVATGTQENVASVAKHLSKLAAIGLYLPSGVGVSKTAAEAIGTLFHHLLLYRGNSNFRFAVGALLDETSFFIRQYFLAKIEAPMDLISRAHVAPITSMSNRMAFAYAISSLCNTALADEISDVERARIRRTVRDTLEPLAKFFREIARSAAQKDSPVLNDLDTSLHHVLVSLARLFGRAIVDEATLSRDISSLLMSYDAIYTTNNAPSYLNDAHDNLLSVGIAFHAAPHESIPLQTIRLLVTIASKLASNPAAQAYADFLASSVVLARIVGSREARVQVSQAIRQRFLPVIAQRANLAEPWPDAVGDLLNEHGMLGLGANARDRAIAEIGQEPMVQFWNEICRELGV